MAPDITLQTDGRGYFAFDEPLDGDTARAYADARIEIDLAGSGQPAVTPIVLPANGALPPTFALMVDGTATEGARCAGASPLRRPTPEDLVTLDAFSTDKLDCGDCLATNRAVESFTLWGVARIATLKLPKSVVKHHWGVSILDKLDTGRFLDAGDSIELFTITESPPLGASRLALAHVFEFRQTWTPDGFSLGDLLYSLPLAPGQKRRVGIVDWMRREAASRSESDELRDEITAEIVRDRDIREVVASTLTEHLEGKSTAISYGNANGGGAAGSGSSGNMSMGAAGGFSMGGGIGSSKAESDAMRHLVASNTQRIDDATRQAASAVRSRRSTVVRALDQTERVEARAEVVANYNHCHALTIQYFEVLRHFLVKHDIASVREALLVPVPMRGFVADATANPDHREPILAWEDEIASAALTPRVLEGLAALRRKQADPEWKLYPLAAYGDEPVQEVVVTMEIEFALLASTPAEDVADKRKELLKLLDVATVVVMVGAAGNSIPITPVGPSDDAIERRLFTGTIPFGATPPVLNTLTTFRCLGPAPSTLRTEFSATARAVNVTYRTAFGNGTLFSWSGSRALHPEITLIRAVPSEERRSPRLEDQQRIDYLESHLNTHAEHYHKAIWLQMDPSTRYNLLDQFTVPQLDISIAAAVENRIIGFMGNSMVMPVTINVRVDRQTDFRDASGNPERIAALYEAQLASAESRICLPTGGVHAEAIMGSCNACEEVDDSRFWRWQDAPIPDDTPAIDPLGTGTRRADLDVAASTLPASIIAMQTAAALPDPAGIKAALDVLGKAGIFPDLSGLAGNQKNAAEALAKNVDAARDYAKMASEMAQKEAATRSNALAQGSKKIANAKDNKEIDGQQAAEATKNLWSQVGLPIESIGDQLSGFATAVKNAATAAGVEFSSSDLIKLLTAKARQAGNLPQEETKKDEPPPPDDDPPPVEEDPEDAGDLERDLDEGVGREEDVELAATDYGFSPVAEVAGFVDDNGFAVAPTAGGGADSSTATAVTLVSIVERELATDYDGNARAYHPADVLYTHLASRQGKDLASNFMGGKDQITATRDGTMATQVGMTQWFNAASLSLTQPFPDDFIDGTNIPYVTLPSRHTGLRAALIPGSLAMQIWRDSAGNWQGAGAVAGLWQRQLYEDWAPGGSKNLIDRATSGAVKDARLIVFPGPVALTDGLVSVHGWNTPELGNAIAALAKARFDTMGGSAAVAASTASISKGKDCAWTRETLNGIDAIQFRSIKGPKTKLHQYNDGALGSAKPIWPLTHIQQDASVPFEIDPAPGFFVSPTALTCKHYGDSTPLWRQTAYLDAVKVSYIAGFSDWAPPGTLVALRLVAGASYRWFAAIIGDSKGRKTSLAGVNLTARKKKYGKLEVSSALLNRLPSSSRVDGDMFFLSLSEARTKLVGWPLTQDTIRTLVKEVIAANIDAMVTKLAAAHSSASITRASIEAELLTLV